MSIELRRVRVVGGQVQPVSSELLFHFESRGWLGQSGSDRRAPAGPFPCRRAALGPADLAGGQPLQATHVTA
jgi:hypothetical protein